MKETKAETSSSTPVCNTAKARVMTFRHQVTGMKHSRSASFETGASAEGGAQHPSSMLGDPMMWPSPSSWTVPSRTYEYRTISFNFSDPRMPGILRKPIKVRSPGLDPLLCLA